MPTSCFPLFSHLFAFVYIYFYSTCPFLLACRFFQFSFSDVFQSGKRCEFFAAFPNHLQPWVSRVQETVPTSFPGSFVFPQEGVVFLRPLPLVGRRKTLGTRLETVLASKAETAIRTYLADFNHWKPWALSNGFCYMPANTFPVAGYLQCLILK